MIELFGIHLGGTLAAASVQFGGVNWGTPFQGISVIGILAILGFVVRTWIVGMPARKQAENDAKRAANEGKVIDNTEVALRFKEWRAEVHAMKNEVTVLRAELHRSDAQRAHNRERFNMVLFILRLVMAELRRIDPNSPVIKQADELLKQVTDEDAPHDAAESAKATVAAAQDTLEQIEKDGK